MTKYIRNSRASWLPGYAYDHRANSHHWLNSVPQNINITNIKRKFKLCEWPEWETRPKSLRTADLE